MIPAEITGSAQYTEHDLTNLVRPRPAAGGEPGHTRLGGVNAARCIWQSRRWRWMCRRSATWG